MSRHRITILSMPTCVKCKTAIMQLEKFCTTRNIPYNIMHAIPEGKDLVAKYNLSAVPTVLAYTEGIEEPKVYTGDFEMEDLFIYLDDEV